MESTMRWMQYLNNRMYAYTEMEQEGNNLCETIQLLTGMEPQVWKHKKGNRQQCYSILYNKLFLAYLISEIQKGTILSTQFLQEIKDYELEVWDDFYYDNTGRNNVGVLDKIFLSVLTDHGYFQYEFVGVDICSEPESYEMDEYLELREMYLVNALCESHPKIGAIRKQLEEDCHESLLLGMYYDVADIEPELFVLESSVLYEIEKAEKKSQTEIGQKILKELEVLESLVEETYYNAFLQWKYQDDKAKKIYYFFLLTADVLGDDYYHPVFTEERLYTFNYSSIFRIQKLNLDIEKWLYQYEKSS